VQCHDVPSVSEVRAVLSFQITVLHAVLHVKSSALDCEQCSRRATLHW
jgi:hypothetical protein